MKATLEFDLGDNEDAQAHLRCIKAKDMAIAIWEVTHNNKNLTDAQIVKKMYEYLNELNIEELIE